MKRQFSVIISLLFLVLPGLTANAAGSASNIRVDYSCPGKVTVTYDLATSQPADLTLKYSPDKKEWLEAKTVTGDFKAQSSGTGKTIVWDCFADNVRTGGFYFKIELLSQPEPECAGVLINGVCWATRNVDEPGTFAANPEDAGKFYQWNRITAWDATGDVTGWGSSLPAGTTWEKVNDPSPVGYRVPTLEEIQKLIDLTRVAQQWVTQNGVTGMKFTDTVTGNFIFMPAAGYRSSFEGTLYGADWNGDYWSSTPGGLGVTYAYGLSFGTSYAGRGNNSHDFGFSVRPVAENPEP